MPHSLPAFPHFLDISKAASNPPFEGTGRENEDLSTCLPLYLFLSSFFCPQSPGVEGTGFLPSPLHSDGT